MPITKFELTNFRLYERASFQPDRCLTIVVGENASGKTSLLEAVHVLSTGRTFRRVQLEQLLREGTKEFGIYANYHPKDGLLPTGLGFSLSSKGRKISINGSCGTRQRDIAQIFPVLVISPDSHFEFQQDKRERRAVLDWILFHVEQDFHENWSRYQRILAQRNMALKSHRFGKATFAWDEELASAGEFLHTLRVSCLSEISGRFERICRRLLPSSAKVRLELDLGWDATTGLAGCLRQDRDRDVARGYSHSGPHRSDLTILIDGHPSQENASHGQNKLLVIALRLAQIEHFYESTGRECCLLVDDLAAELDTENRGRLASFLADMPVQAIITATDAEQFDCRLWSSYKTFHVKHGSISEITSPEIRHQFG